MILIIQCPAVVGVEYRSSLQILSKNHWNKSPLDLDKIPSAILLNLFLETIALVLETMTLQKVNPFSPLPLSFVSS